MNKKEVISFAALKSWISIQDVLARYVDDLPPVEEGRMQLRLPCPLCEYTTNCLSVSTEKNIFKCFHCGVQGNILDFVTAAEGVDLKKAGQLLSQWFPEADQPKSAGKGKQTKKRKKSSKKVKPQKDLEPLTVKKEAKSAVRENPVLGFELKNIDHLHPSLDTLGLPDHVLLDYEIGYYSGRGSLKGSIVMPVRRGNGDLIAYLGFDSNRQVTYPPEDKFNPQCDLFGLDAISKKVSGECLYLVSNPVDVLVCAAFECTALATMCAVPSDTDCAVLQEIAERYDSKVYLVRDNQDDTEIGKICCKLLEKTSFSWEYRSLEQQFLAS